MPSFYHLLTMVSLVSGFIERDMGGEVTFSDNKDENGVILRWRKRDAKNMKTLHFNYKISYDEIEDITEPYAFAEKIMEKYREKEKNG